MNAALPARLWLVRHGESLGNLAAAAAERDGLLRVVLPTRDVETPLSPLGRDQADALGRRFAMLPAGERPDLLLVSPYLRAQETAQRLAAGLQGVPLRTDERLREKEFGILDGLTRAGVAQLEPAESERRRRLGKFYHRPPGGESWCDIVLRVRSLLATPALAERRVMIVAHQVVLRCLRYVLEELDEATLLAMDAAGPIANGAVMAYRRGVDLEGQPAMVLEQ